VALLLLLALLTTVQETKIQLSYTNNRTFVTWLPPSASWFPKFFMSFFLIIEPPLISLLVVSNKTLASSLKQHREGAAFYIFVI